MIVTIATTKGGAAKTTTAMLLAEAAGRAGYSTLVIDADPPEIYDPVEGSS